MEKRPCAEWYQLDKSCDIFDGDGFNRGNKSASVFWYFVPVSRDYYENGMCRCSVVPFNKINHIQPFQLLDEDRKMWQEFQNSGLGKLILQSMSVLK
jgi:hypothetical protein